MKRFHVHLHVDNLDQSIAFYSRLFAAEPSRVEADYAKWMLDDPRVNFAISTRGAGTGRGRDGVVPPGRGRTRLVAAPPRLGRFGRVGDASHQGCPHISSFVGRGTSVQRSRPPAAQLTRADVGP